MSTTDRDQYTNRIFKLFFFSLLHKQSADVNQNPNVTKF